MAHIPVLVWIRRWGFSDSTCVDFVQVTKICEINCLLYRFLLKDLKTRGFQNWRFKKPEVSKIRGFQDLTKNLLFSNWPIKKLRFLIGPTNAVSKLAHQKNYCFLISPPKISCFSIDPTKLIHQKHAISNLPTKILAVF